MVVYWVLMCLLKQEGWHMQNASIPSNSIPQAAMNHLTSSGGVILPNGAVMVLPLLLPRHNPPLALHGTEMSYRVADTGLWRTRED